MTDEDALIARLCQLIVESPKYEDTGWEGISVVCDVHDGGSTNVTGYYFTTDPYADRAWQVRAPNSSRELLDLLRALNAAMLERTGARWKSCLVQIVRDGMSFAIDFEYDRDDRWDPMPGTPARKGFPMTINPQNSGVADEAKDR